ncbi:MAG: VOC family protein [Pseudomonadota bacterium]
MPALTCRDLRASAQALSRSFGFELAGFWADGDAPPHFAILRLGDVTLALHQSDEPAGSPGFAAYLYIDDAESLAELALAQGALIDGPLDQPWRCREVRYTDRDGNQIVFAQDLAPGPEGPGL